MKVLNLLTSGNIGGIESLCRDIGTISSMNNGYCFLFQGGVIFEQMKAKGLVTYCLSNDGGKLSLKKLKKLKKIAADYDVIVVHHGDPFLKLYFYLLMREYPKKYITVVHSCYEDEYFYPGSKLKKLLAKFIFQISMTKSDKIVFVSEAGKRSYQKAFKISNEKSAVVYNGVGIDKLEAGKELTATTPECYHVTYIGRLKQVKGVNLLIDSIGKLAEKYPVCLSIVGEGDMQNKLEEQVEKLGLQSKVTFYGKQADVIPFLKETDIFVYPSVWQEVFGISVIEAMAFGKLCVVNRVGGLPEIIQDGVNGFLTNTASADGVAEAIERAILSYQDGTFAAISKEARRTAETFSIANTANKLEQLMNTL